MVDPRTKTTMAEWLETEEGHTKAPERYIAASRRRVDGNGRLTQEEIDHWVKVLW